MYCPNCGSDSIIGDGEDNFVCDHCSLGFEVSQYQFPVSVPNVRESGDFSADAIKRELESSSVKVPPDDFNLNQEGQRTMFVLCKLISSDGPVSKWQEVKTYRDKQSALEDAALAITLGASVDKLAIREAVTMINIVWTGKDAFK